MFSKQSSLVWCPGVLQLVAAPLRRREGLGGMEMTGLMSSVPEIGSHAPRHTTTSPRWITGLKSEQGDTLPPPHLLGPTENQSGSELLGVSTELHCFLAGRKKACKG